MDIGDTLNEIPCQNDSKSDQSQNFQTIVKHSDDDSDESKTLNKNNSVTHNERLGDNTTDKDSEVLLEINDEDYSQSTSFDMNSTLNDETTYRTSTDTLDTGQNDVKCTEMGSEPCTDEDINKLDTLKLPSSVNVDINEDTNELKSVIETCSKQHTQINEMPSVVSVDLNNLQGSNPHSDIYTIVDLNNSQESTTQSDMDNIDIQASGDTIFKLTQSSRGDDNKFESISDSCLENTNTANNLYEHTEKFASGNINSQTNSPVDGTAESTDNIQRQLDNSDTERRLCETSKSENGASQNETQSGVQILHSTLSECQILHSTLSEGENSGDVTPNSHSECSNISTCDTLDSIGISYVPVRDVLNSNVYQTIDESDDLLSQLESELRTEIPESNQTEIDTDTSRLSTVVPVDTDTRLSTVVRVDTVQNSTKTTGHYTEESTVQTESLLNGISSKVLQTLPAFLDLQNKYDTLQKLYAEKDIEIKTLCEEKHVISGSLQNALKDKDRLNERLKAIEEKSTTGEQTYITIVKELENTIVQQRQEHDATKEKLRQHDEAAKKAIYQIQTDLQSKLSQISKAYEECKREKEGMVVKYAVAEQKNIEMEDRMQKNIKKTQEWEKEKDLAVSKFKSIRADRGKLEEVFHQRNAEIVSLRRELEKFKELRSEQELKSKWHQNKLRTELDAHKDTKNKFDDASKKLKQARDEAENMKRDCQTMIKQYQETEECQKSTLVARIGQKEEKLKQQQQEVSDQQDVHSLVKTQLDTLKRNHKDMIEELRTAKDKITCLEAERLHQEDTMHKFKDTLQHQKQDNKDLYDKLAQLEGIEHQLSIEKEKVSSMKVRVEELEELNRDLRADMEGCARREGEHLEFTKRVSDKNAKLQSENSGLSNKLTSLNDEHLGLTRQHLELKQANEKLESDLREEQQRRIEEIGNLRVKLEDKTKAVEELSQQLEDQRDDNRVLKRRHAANIKDIHRQLQHTHKRLERGSMNGEISSMGSRTSSNNSLNTLVNSEPQLANTSPILEEMPLPQEQEAPIVQFVDVDKQVLVEKIVRLQKAHARKNEKIEFMEEHINQLVNELQRKARLIQSYVMREESGTLAPESMDLNKAQLSKRGGIMSSVYHSTSRDDHMTMDLSLEINHKLQAVLEDTLLKNITLKESMDTLGKEISELSKQNRALQLHMQSMQAQTSTKS